MIISNVQNTNLVNSVKINTQTDFKSKSTAPVEPVKRIDSFEKEGEVSESVAYEPPKKLTTEQIEALSRERMESTLSIVTESVEGNVNTQASISDVMFNGFEISSESADFLTEIFGSLENALPTPATTPEGALADISEGGAYSIEAVSERIMLMATAIAGDDMELLGEMQDAVIKGFEAAGLDTNTGEGMPEITMDTYEHVMKAFEALKTPTTDEETA